MILWCDFDNYARPLCGFTQSENNDFDWIRHYGSTDSPGTGPSYDHSTGNGKYSLFGVYN